MKRIVLFVSLLVSLCALRAQDTINPEIPGLYYIDTSYIHIENYYGTGHFFSPIVEVDNTSMTCYGNLIGAVKYIGHQVTISGIALPFIFNTYPEFLDSWNHLYGALITIEGNDYSHPTIHLTNSYVTHDDPYNCHIALNAESECGKMDTLVDAYALYFNEPINVSGSFYVGYYLKQGHFRYGIGHETNAALSCDSYSGDIPIYDSSVVSYNLFDDDSTVRGYAVNFCPMGIYWLFCPIQSIPDTDSFGCPEVEGFGFAGMMAGSPTFTWAPAAEHRLYQLAYGPYDAPLDSLQVVETDNYFLELSDPSLSRDIYYQARLRAKCHHRCPIHDTVMWTAWTDPVYFYTGDNMPDTTHHHGEPESIAEVNGPVHFALAPNPAHGSVTLTLEGMPVAGTVLTIHDGAGREVLHRTLHERVTRIATKGLAAGVYTVTVSNPQGMGTHRLSVE